MLNQGEKPVMRIYFKDMDTPGLAMSRSIGDTDAHSIGVIEIPGKLNSQHIHTIL